MKTRLKDLPKEVCQNVHQLLTRVLLAKDLSNREQEELLDILDFALENAFIQMPSGEIYRQAAGIPMGDPLSPGMDTIANLFSAPKRPQQVVRVTLG